MTCRILLLIKLTSCVCGTFVVNVTQTSYQAEENHNITLEWTFTTTKDMSLHSLYIYCDMINPLKNPGVFHLHEGVEVSESQDEQFSGRVQFDKDVLREGRLRLHVSRLRTEDSGLYVCEVKTDDGVNLRGCRLNVTAAADESKPQRPTLSPQPESRGRTGLYAGLGLTAAAVLLFAFSPCLIRFAKRKRRYLRSLRDVESQRNPQSTNKSLTPLSDRVIHTNTERERETCIHEDPSLT